MQPDPFETPTSPADDPEHDAVPVGLCVISRDMRFVRVNETMAQINGHDIEDHLGRAVSEVAPDREPLARQRMDQVIKTREVIGPFEVVGEACEDPGKQRYWMEFWSPLKDDAGEVVAASVASIEITERKRLEYEKEQALEETKRRLKQQTAIAETGQLALQDVSFQTILDKAVTAAADALEVPLTKILAFEDSAEHLKLVSGIGWKEGLVGSARVGTERASQAGYTLKSGEVVVVEDLATEVRFSGPALLHEHGVVSGMSVTITGTEGRPYGVFGVHDVRHQKFDQGDANFLMSLAAIISYTVRRDRAQAQSTLLIREMSHRAGNMLQLVSSIAAQTFRHATDTDKAREAFNSRLASLARANHAIARQGWSSTRFKQVVEETLSPFADKIQMMGNDILLPPEMSFDLGLVLSELCTNSSKYGSLGLSDGAVTLRWSINSTPDGAMFKAEWMDSVSRAYPSPDATSGGFGTRLIHQLVERKWQGSITVSQGDDYRMTVVIPVPQSTSDVLSSSMK